MSFCLITHFYHLPSVVGYLRGLLQAKLHIYTWMHGHFVNSMLPSNKNFFCQEERMCMGDIINEIRDTTRRTKITQSTIQERNHVSGEREREREREMGSDIREIVIILFILALNHSEISYVLFCMILLFSAIKRLAITHYQG